MRNDFDEIRAERDMPGRYRHEGNRFAGLWKQIALGIIVGNGVLALLAAVVWLLMAGVAIEGLSFGVR